MASSGLTGERNEAEGRRELGAEGREVFLKIYRMSLAVLLELILALKI